MAIKDKVKNKSKSKGSLASKAKARATEPVTAGAEETVKEGATGNLSAPSPLPTQIKQPLPDYPYIKSYAMIPALRKGGGLQGGGA